MEAKTQFSLWRIYGFAWLLTIVLLGLVLASSSWSGLIKVLILATLEIAFSFDNAVINAKILTRLSRFWQQMFMTVGIAIAVFGMRIIFPIVLVSATAGIGFREVINLALHDPAHYGAHLRTAHPLIASFGGMFLLMIFLDFFLEDRAVKWLRQFENTSARLGKLKNLSLLLGLTILLMVGLIFAHSSVRTSVLLAGFTGLGVYLAINTLDNLLTGRKTITPMGVKTVVAHGFIGFLYLELIDASFSLDGVLGAFAITNKLLLIAAGLGIGALYVRSLTVHMLHRGILTKYIYIEHGAHYAIGLLALLLLASIRHQIPELITGLGGAAIIAVAVTQSHFEAKRHNIKPLI